MWWKRDWTKRKKDRYTPDTQVPFEVPASIACQLRWFFLKILLKSTEQLKMSYL